MEMLMHRPFTCDEKAYDLRVLKSEKTVTVAVFASNRPVSGLRYQIQVPAYSSAERIIDSEAFEAFLEHARDDISARLWERMLEQE